MSRYVIQSAFTGCFLAPSQVDGQPEWVTLLREACVVSDLENVSQLVEDHVDAFHRVTVVDLDTLHAAVEI